MQSTWVILSQPPLVYTHSILNLRSWSFGPAKWHKNCNKRYSIKRSTLNAMLLLKSFDMLPLWLSSIHIYNRPPSIFMIFSLIIILSLILVRLLRVVVGLHSLATAEMDEMGHMGRNNIIYQGLEVPQIFIEHLLSIIKACFYYLCKRSST
jgi:hypothetical protein